jgi:polysaccharide export outer membrane protein
MSPLLALLLTCTALAGEGPWSAAGAPPASAPTVGEVAGYRVGPGDTVQVQVYGEPTLTGAFPVSEAGVMNFPLVGSVPVAGRTAIEVASVLRQRLADGYVVDPHVTAWLDSYRSQAVQVMGGVREPGQVFLRGPTSVLEVLSAAGGVKGLGASEVQVTRASTGQTQRLSIERLLSTGEGNISLQGGDVVFVPENLISVMGKVQKPGDVAFREGMTVATTIAAAGGALPEANLGRVYILRGDERIRINLRRVLSGRSPDVAVQSGDRVFVRESVF